MTGPRTAHLSAIDMPASDEEIRTRIAAWGHPHAAELREALAAEVRRGAHSGSDVLGRRARSADPEVDPSNVLLTVLVYDDQTPVATGSLQDCDGYTEVVRCFVSPTHRRRGLARRVLAELEEFARAAGIDELVAGIGVGQVEGESLCVSEGWVRVEPFGSHTEGAGVCFMKAIDLARVGGSIARAGIV